MIEPTRWAFHTPRGRIIVGLLVAVVAVILAPDSLVLPPALFLLGWVAAGLCGPEEPAAERSRLEVLASDMRPSGAGTAYWVTVRDLSSGDLLHVKNPYRNEDGVILWSAVYEGGHELSPAGVTRIRVPLQLAIGTSPNVLL